MAILTLRETKGSPLTNAELDANFTNMNIELGMKLDAALYTAQDVLNKVKSFPDISSGLSAQFLLGRSSSAAAVANTVVVRDDNASFAANNIFATFIGPLQSASVSITGGSITNLNTPISVGSGGTGGNTPAAARLALGLTIGAQVQAYSVSLNAIAQLAPSANSIPYYTSTSAAALTGLTAFGRTLISRDNAAIARTTLGVEIGVNVQAFSTALTGLANVTGSGLIARNADNNGSVTRTITGSSRIQVVNGNGVNGNPTINLINEPTEVAAKGFIAFNPSSGEVASSRNMTVSKSSVGVYICYLDPSIRTGNTNFGAIVNPVDKGTGQGNSISAGSMDIYGISITDYNAAYVIVRVFRRYNNGVVFAGGDDSNTIHRWTGIPLDPNRITVVIY